MTASDTMVIVGAGQAGAWAARTLRDSGFEGRIVLLGAERHPPYERPPLSKGLITGASFHADAELLGLAEMQDKGITFLPEMTVRKIDRERHSVQCADGTEMTYDRLLLAMGGRPWLPPIAGLGSARVRVLRSVDDALALREALLCTPRVVVIGGGWIGLELAATARGMGCEVDVIEAGPRLCARSVMPPVSFDLLARHEQAGVRIRVGQTVSALHDAADTTQVELADGERLDAGLIVLGAGMRPNEELAVAAGLACDRGVKVDAACRTSDAHIFAAGDVAVLTHPYRPAGLRLESWQNAQDQGMAAARAMLGQPVVYAPCPLVWSEQYGHLIQIAGYPDLAVRTLSRSTPNAGRLYLGLDQTGVPVAAIGIDAGRDFRSARRWVEQAAMADLAGFDDCAADFSLNCASEVTR